MSHLHGPRKKPCSTHTSLKYSPSSPPSTSWVEELSEHEWNQLTSDHLGQVLPAQGSPLGGDEVVSSPSLMMRMSSPPSVRDSSSRTCPGTQTQALLPPPAIVTPVARRLVDFCEPTTSTSPKPNSSSPHSGSISSREIPSTSIISSRRSTMLSLMKRERVAWEKRKLLLELLKLRNEFPQPLQYFTLPHQSDRIPIGLIGLRSDSE